MALRNLGHLPARNVSWSVSIGALDNHGKLPPTDPADHKKTGGMLPPDTEMIVQSGVLFTDKMSNATFVWGIATYEDGFGNPRFTKFCHFYRTKEFINRTDVEIPGDRAQFYELGNDAD